LLDDEKKINPDFWEVEEQLNERGIIFGVASGRQHANLLDKFNAIKDRVLIVAENGTYVTWRGEEITCNSLDRLMAHQLIDRGRLLTDAYVIVCGKNSAYVENTDEVFLKEARSYYHHLEIVNDLTLVEDDVLKITICDFIDAGTHSYRQFKDFEKDCSVTVSGKIWLDISNRSANKGTALRIIQDKFTISANETLVFGDFLNDKEMLEQARFSFAMKNAHPELIEVARFVTEFDNNHNGVVETIRKVCLLNGEEFVK